MKLYEVLLAFTAVILVVSGLSKVPEQSQAACTKPNELWVKKSESCNRDLCKVPNYLVACQSTSKPGCFCQCGYCRDFEDNCVPQDQFSSFDNVGYKSWCPKPKCHGPHEVYKTCASFCGGNCRDIRIPINYLCIQGCKIGCVCKNGYFRHPITQKCVAKDKCPTTEEYDYKNNKPITP